MRRYHARIRGAPQPIDHLSRQTPRPGDSRPKGARPNEQPDTHQGDHPFVDIHYGRPGRRHTIYRQFILDQQPGLVVTFQPDTRLHRPLMVDGEVILEDHAPAIWFTFPDAWHDIGLFHRADGTPTGIYANILTPVQMPSAQRWLTTDLFLDVWIPNGGPLQILDEAELEEAVTRRHLDGSQAAQARAEASRLAGLYRGGAWPPPVVSTWDLARATSTLPLPPAHYTADLRPRNTL